jgi:tripartite-type tricarboxylate transporter receptor subunit TctC
MRTTSRRTALAVAAAPWIATGGWAAEVEAIAWHGIFAPARTPQYIVETLQREIVKALRNPDVNDLLAKQAMQPVGTAPHEFAAFLKKDRVIWKEVATAANVSVE